MTPDARATSFKQPLSSEHSAPSQKLTIDALRLDAISKTYNSKGIIVTALDKVNLSLAPTTFTAIMGPSGSGKSTLLHCASGLDKPTRGQVFIDGAKMNYGNETELTKFRRSRIGFVFQQFNLLPALTVWQNVILPLRLAGVRVDEQHCRTVLAQIGLAERLHHRPTELSGGQQQRVAIARALVLDPKLLFADEPTGALDTQSAHGILELFSDAVHTYNQTVVMVTHDPVAASYADAVVFLSDGKIVDTLPNPTASAVAERMTHLNNNVIKRQMQAVIS